jgi:redox-sensitive bicupin YhaK (pirin superfamily)
MSSIKRTFPLGFPWQTSDPFLFCVYHKDDYPTGNDEAGPNASLEGRSLGNDFVVKDGFRMYHGQTIPGFPAHPHRGFETVTVVPKGLVDHSDSIGAAGRFGNGDTQWMTAGRGVQHSEMFPLLNKDEPNPLVLFQIWLNLPKAGKFVDPHFAMLWREDMPIYGTQDENGNAVSVRIVAGHIEDHQAPAPPPDSWAAKQDHEVAIWVIKLAPNAKWTMPTASAEANRTIYFYQGEELSIDGQTVQPEHGTELNADQATVIQNGGEEAHLLLLQGRPINEPVAQYGPFVMNTQQEIQQAMRDYQLTQFGGWPWPSHDHVHDHSKGRFAKHADGRLEIKG